MSHFFSYYYETAINLISLPKASLRQVVPHFCRLVADSYTLKIMQ